MKVTPARYFTQADRTTVSLVVIHTAECGEVSSAAENLAAWGAGPNANKASWHYAVDNDLQRRPWSDPLRGVIVIHGAA